MHVTNSLNPMLKKKDFDRYTTLRIFKEGNGRELTKPYTYSPDNL